MKKKTMSLLFYFFPVNQDDDSNSAMYQAVSELPQANRDTLAFIIKHLQRFVVEYCLK